MKKTVHVILLGALALLSSAPALLAVPPDCSACNCSISCNFICETDSNITTCGDLGICRGQCDGPAALAMAGEPTLSPAGDSPALVFPAACSADPSSAATASPAPLTVAPAVPAGPAAR
jgi:hypothetical protein